jgi:hypothetical protein
MWPDFDFILVSVDSAFTEKEENDPTGCTTWGVWTNPADGYPKVMLVMAWRKHLPVHGEEQEPQERGESDADYASRYGLSLFETSLGGRRCDARRAQRADVAAF